VKDGQTAITVWVVLTAPNYLSIFTQEHLNLL